MIAILIYFSLIIYKLLYLPPFETNFFYWNIENYLYISIYMYIYMSLFFMFNSCSQSSISNNCDIEIEEIEEIEDRS